MQFRIRSLLVLTVLVAILTLPAYRFSVKLYQKWNQTEDVAPSSQVLTSFSGLTVELPALAVTSVSTIVSVPDGETRIWSGVKPPLREGVATTSN